MAKFRERQKVNGAISCELVRMLPNQALSKTFLEMDQIGSKIKLFEMITDLPKMAVATCFSKQCLRSDN